MEIEQVAHKDAELRKDHIWEKGPPKEYATRGFFSSTLSLEGYERTAYLLTTIKGFPKENHEGNRF